MAVGEDGRDLQGEVSDMIIVEIRDDWCADVVAFSAGGHYIGAKPKCGQKYSELFRCGLENFKIIWI